jgi:putative alpha-1,2-mannosidase
MKTALQQLVNRAQQRWNSEVFSKIQVAETNTTNLRLLYGTLYGMYLLPSNRT